MSSIKPNDGCGQINSSEEVASGFVIAGGDGAILFQAAEEVLDEMPRRIEFRVVKESSKNNLNTQEAEPSLEAWRLQKRLKQSMRFCLVA